ncbi:MAG: FAD-binding oxidoreductase [Gaiellales bacterium]
MERTRDHGSTDIAVVGGGITGLSVAWHLAQRGAEVVIVERGGLGSGATAIQPGGLRRQWGSEVNCLLASEAREFYMHLADRLDVRVDPGFRECGYLFVAHSRDGEEALARNVSVQNACGVPSRMVDPREASDLVPGLDAGSIVAASFCPEDGYFDRPQAVVAAFVDACRAAGIGVIQAPVARLDPGDRGWSLDLLDGGTIEARGVVVAAAWETPALLSPLGVHVPIKKEPRYLFYSDPIQERLLEPLVVSAEWHLAAKQLADGSVLASDLVAGADPGEDEAIWRARLRDGLQRLLPILDYVEYPTLVEGFYDLTPDGLAIIGPVADHQGLWLAAGHSGRGFMLAPAIGRALSDAIVDSNVDPLIEDLALERFREAGLTLESQVV